MKDNITKTIATMFLERMFQLMFWSALGFIVIKFGVPLLGDAIGEVYQGIREYFVAAPAAEQATLGFLGLF